MYIVICRHNSVTTSEGTVPGPYAMVTSQVFDTYGQASSYASRINQGAEPIVVELTPKWDKFCLAAMSIFENTNLRKE